MENKLHLLCVGAHTGDLELQVGAIAHKYVKNGHKVTFLHMTAGEKGAPPQLSVEEFKEQKIEESKKAAKILGVETMTLDYKDAELKANEATVLHVAKIIRQLKPDIAITHWVHSMHPDHEACPEIVQNAWLKAALEGFEIDGLPPHSLKGLFHSENWEDMKGYEPDIYIDVSEEFNTYLEAISQYSFVMNSSSFRYYDYYKSLGTMRGCLARVKYAQTLKYPDGANVHKVKEIPKFPL